jgi:CheY-like chemotaxis protein
LPRLFQPFMQADRTLDRSGGGLGLGLALVKGLVELHGGEVSARSEGQGKGAEFTVHLPLDAVAAGGRNVRVPRRRSAREQPPRVLVIEDDADVAEGLRAALEVERHDVRVAHDGHEGIARARELVPDIVLCDIGLPGMDGYEVARSFRADRALRSTFLVALSGYAQPEDLVKARAAGFDHHLAKPASIDKIMQTFAARSTPRRRSAAPGGARRRSRGARVS